MGAFVLLTTVTLPTDDRIDLMSGLTGLVRVSFHSATSNVWFSTSNTATSDSNGAVRGDLLARNSSAGIEAVVLDWDSSIPLYAYGNGAGIKLSYSITSINSVGLSVNCS